MGTGADARLLINKALKSNKSEIMQLKKTLGAGLRPMLGFYNGYYVLDMAKALDRLCLVKLLEASSTRGFMRRRNTILPMGRVAVSYYIDTYIQIYIERYIHT